MDEEGTGSVRFNLIKSDNFATHHADGVLTRATPKGFANLSFFVERWAIPKSFEQELTKDGLLGDVINVKGKEGIVQEFQTGVIMDLPALKLLHHKIELLIEEMETDYGNDDEEV